MTSDGQSRSSQFVAAGFRSKPRRSAKQRRDLPGIRDGFFCEPLPGTPLPAGRATSEAPASVAKGARIPFHFLAPGRVITSGPVQSCLGCIMSIDAVALLRIGDLPPPPTPFGGVHPVRHRGDATLINLMVRYLDAPPDELALCLRQLVGAGLDSHLCLVVAAMLCMASATPEPDEVQQRRRSS